VRLFVVDAGEWTELTDGAAPTVRVSAPDLAQARRIRSGLKSEDAGVSVILDVTVAVAGDYRSARRSLTVAGPEAQVRYVGTVDGLAGLVADIAAAGVADGVTLIPADAESELRPLGDDVVRRVQLREQARRAS
jgi:hypothetical protein